jgi:hypothetical protein
MKKASFLIFFICLIFSSAHAQIKTPDKRPFNIGLFTGLGGVVLNPPIPALDIHFKGNILRVAPGYRDFAGGYTREIMPLSKVFYNWFWIGSLYGGIQKEDNLYPPLSARGVATTTHYSGMLLSGVKTYFAKRWYSQFQLGLKYNVDKTPDYANKSSFMPYFEFTIGINLFKNFLNEEEFE